MIPKFGGDVPDSYFSLGCILLCINLALKNNL